MLYVLSVRDEEGISFVIDSAQPIELEDWQAAVSEAGNAEDADYRTLQERERLFTESLPLPTAPPFDLKPPFRFYTAQGKPTAGHKRWQQAIDAHTQSPEYQAYDRALRERLAAIDDWQEQHQVRPLRDYYLDAIVKRGWQLAANVTYLEAQ